jgi:hypothetical protein
LEPTTSGRWAKALAAASHSGTVGQRLETHAAHLAHRLAELSGEPQMGEKEAPREAGAVLLAAQHVPVGVVEGEGAQRSTRSRRASTNRAEEPGISGM